MIIDLTAATRVVSEQDFADWARVHSVFLSSVMGELREERRAIATALEDAGFTVRWFEDFGGRDDAPDAAYLTEVAAADIYVGILANDYGAMHASGYSATHEEYLEARQRGKRVSFWARDEDSGRQGHARRFLEEVQVFKVAGRFCGGDDLTVGLLRRLREMAAEDLSPWIKLGDVIFRAETITETGSELRVEARIRDGAVMEGLRALAPDPEWGRQGEAAVTYAGRAGTGRLAHLAVQTQSSATQQVRLKLEVKWASGANSMSMGGVNGISDVELTEIGVRMGLLGEPPPARLQQQLGGFGRMSLSGAFVDPTDPLAELAQVRLAEGSMEQVARLLVVEHLVGSGRVAAVEDFELGPQVGGRRHVRIRWREHRTSNNQPVGRRAVEGDRAW